MSWFKQNKALAGHVMSAQDVVRNILKKLDAKQNNALETAMNELKNDGLVEAKEDGVTLMLTQKGADTL